MPFTQQQQQQAERDRLNRISGLRIDPRPTMRENLLREQAEQDDKVGLFRLTGDAISSQWMGAWAMRRFARRGYEADPDFNFMEQETFDHLTEGVPPDMWHQFATAVSLPHAERMREQMLDVTEKRTRLSNAGLTGTALRVGASILDPAALAISFGTAGVGGAAVYGARLTRLQRLTRGGLVASGGELAIEGYLSTEDPQRGVRDVLYAGVGGMVLGGGLNVVAGRGHRRALEQAAHQARRDIEFDELATIARQQLGEASTPADVNRWVSENVLSDDGRAYFRHQLSAQRQREIADDLIAKSGLDPELDADVIAELRQVDPAELATYFGRPQRAEIPPPGVAAEEAVQGVLPSEWGMTPKSNLHAGDLDLSGVSSARASMTWLRRSFASILGGSDAESVRRAASAYADDALLKADGSGGTMAASVWTRQQTDIHLSQYNRRAIPEFQDWAQAKGKRPSWEFNMKDRAEFMEEVGRAIRQPRGRHTTDPHVNAVADLQRDLQLNLLNINKRHGAKGFDRVPPSDTYLTRAFRQSALNDIVARYGEDSLVRLIRGAILSGSDDLSEEAANTIARGYTRTQLKLGDRSDLEKARLFASDDPEAIAQMIRESIPGVTDAQVEDVLSAIRPRSPDAGRSPRAMRRLALDENYQMQMPDGRWVGVADLMENNAETIFNMYTRQMTGNAAASEVYRVMKGSAEDVIDTFDQLANRLKRQGASDRDIDLLRTLDKHVRGIPLGKNTQAAKAMRVLRAYNYIRVSGQFGLAQIPEVANVIAETGFRVMLQQVPALGRVFSRARSGRMTNELLEEIETWTGIGTERLTNQVINRFDASGAMVEFGGGGVEQTLRRGGRVASDVSLLAPINMSLQRYSGAAAAQRLTNLAFTGKKMSARRRQQLGLSEADADRVYAQIRKHATTEEGMLGKRLKRINLDAWDDQQAAAMLVGGLDRWSRRAVQVNDIGQLHPFMTTDMGRSILQFRTFFVAAWEKQFLHKVQMHDVQAFTSMMMGMMVAGMVYTGQEYVLAQGRRDRDEYLRERLSDGAIARAAFQRAGWSTLVPSAIETANHISGGSPLFDQRNSGLDADFFFGNPSVDAIRGGGRALRGLGQAARGEDEFTEADARTFTQLAPFQRVIGVRNMINAFQAQFPED